MSEINETNETISLNLTKAEVLMLQELTSETEHSYQWMKEIVENLRCKALAAYKKPFMDASDYADLLESERRLWRGESIQAYMVRAKQKELEFLYDVEEIE